MYEGYVSRLVVVRYLLMPYVRHVYVLLALVRPHVPHVHLGLRITVSSKGRTTSIWCFGCSFAYATAMGCAGLKLLFGTIIVL